MPRQIERAGNRPIFSLLSEMGCMGLSYDAVYHCFLSEMGCMGLSNDAVYHSFLSETECMGLSYDAVYHNPSSIGRSMTASASQNWKIPHYGARHCHQISLDLYLPLFSCSILSIFFSCPGAR